MDGRRIAVRAQQEIGVGGAVDRRDADDAEGALRPHQGDLDPPLAACPGTERKLDVFRTTAPSRVTVTAPPFCSVVSTVASSFGEPA